MFANCNLYRLQNPQWSLILDDFDRLDKQRPKLLLRCLDRFHGVTLLLDGGKLPHGPRVLTLLLDQSPQIEEIAPKTATP
jgi:hypothetical protein